MSRPNPPRNVFAEDHLAARITIEREQRGWTLEGLAKRMTDAGCPLAPSAIYKVEQGQPRRRIVVDELVAFSRVFGIPVEQLLLDPELEADQRVIDLLNAVNTFAAARAEAESKLIGAVDEVRGLVKGSKRAEDVLVEHLEAMAEPGEYFRVRTALENTERLWSTGARPQTEQPENEEG